MRFIKELWEYREMLVSLVKKDLKTRYKGSVLGFLWTFLNPFLQLLVYTLLFSVIMRQGIENYAMFLFVALVPWLFLSTSLVSGSSCIMAAQGLVQKIYFPRIIIPISNVCSNFANMLFSFVIVFIGLFVTGVGVSPVAFVLPAIM
ncbi:ABC transporter permease, partial [Christensenellaceae bacterium OttesenSCG-928-K19]|nr:ABC transporter permease [Christensenellaceae bacterium OttesenSCG-928-K19]